MDTLFHVRVCAILPSFFILVGSLSDDPGFAYSDLDREDQGEADRGTDQYYLQDSQREVDVAAEDLGYFQDLVELQ